MAQSGPEFDFRLTDLGRAYLRMTPALVATWLVAAAPPGPGFREVFLTSVLSVFIVAAVARSRGIGQGSALRHGLRRAASHSLNVLLLLLFLFLAAGLGATVGGMAADGIGLPQVAGQATGGLLAILPVLWWHWPVLVLACVTPEAAGERRPMTPWLWRGPGYTAARRLLRAFGSPHRTGLIVGLGLLWVAVLAAAEWYRGTGPLPAVIEAASYGVFLPLLAWMATVEGHRLVSSVPAAFAVEAATPPLAPLLGLAVALAACGGSAGAPESGPVPPRLAVAGLAHRQCRYVEAGTASAFSRQTRPGTRGDIALWGRAMETEDTVELSIRYDDGGRLEWVRALRATLPAGRVADLERLIFSNLLESGPADWGIRVRVIGGDVAGAEPSVICRPEREVGGTLPMTPVTARALQELYDVRGRRFGVIVTLDEQGRVMNAEIDRPTGYTSVDQYIMDLVRASRFEPKLHDGFGVATTYEFPIWFRRR